MKKSFKGFLACLLALMLVLPAFGGIMAETVNFDGELNGRVGTREAVSGSLASDRNGTLVSKKTASIDLSSIRNGKTFQAADAKAADEIAPDSIVTIMIEMDGAPAVDVVEDVKNAGSYRETLVAKQNAAAARIADELGVDSTLAKRAGLLHDIGKALTQEVEGSHVQIGVDIAKKYKENKDVIHAIEAHHGDVEAKTLTAVIIQAADAISAARPGARREDLESYIKRLQKLEEIAKSFPGVEKSYAIQAGRELRIMVKPEEVNDESMVLVARDIVKKIESELEYPGQIKVNLIRESRYVDVAK